MTLLFKFIQWVIMKRRGFVQWFEIAISRLLLHAELQRPVSHGNIYKVNIVSLYWCFNCSHWALPHTLNFSQNKGKLFQQAMRWMQILSDCNPGSSPTKCIKLIAMQNGVLIFSLLQVLMCMTVSEGMTFGRYKGHFIGRLNLQPSLV